MEVSHKKFGKCVLVELTQKQLERLHGEMRSLNGDDNVPMTIWRGNSVRAVAKLELMTEPKWTMEDVDNASPGHVHWLSEQIVKWQSEALSIDPLS